MASAALVENENNPLNPAKIKTASARGKDAELPPCCSVGRNRSMD
jgi:hypothetical protein